MTADHSRSAAAAPAAGQPRVPWRAVVAFVVLACGLAWLVALPLWLGDGLASPTAGLLLPLMMFTPAVAAVIVTWVFRAPPRERARFLGLWPLRPAGRLILFLALGLVLPIVSVVATALASGALGLVRLDLVAFSGFAAQVAAVAPPGAPAVPIAVLVVAQFAAIPMGAFVNSFLAFGEELGWRGWLQTVLLPLGTWPAMLITGAVWGLWHAPVILLGYNFGRPDAVGVLLMVGGCIAWGFLLGWLRLRSASIWPAVLAHGSLNAAGALVLVLVAEGETPDLAWVGALGVVSWAVLAVIVGTIAVLRQYRSGAVAPAAGSVPAPVPAPAPEGDAR